MRKECSTDYILINSDLNGWGLSHAIYLYYWVSGDFNDETIILDMNKILKSNDLKNFKPSSINWKDFIERHQDEMPEFNHWSKIGKR
jgi:hypothetical protein